LLTLNDLAALSRLSIRTLQRQIAAGQLQAVRLGRRVRFRRADVDAWIAGAIR
jgi:excisionase family DNA binding protein